MSNTKTIVLRLPEDLVTKIDQAAEYDVRSRNSWCEQVFIAMFTEGGTCPVGLAHSSGPISSPSEPSSASPQRPSTTSTRKPATTAGTEPTRASRSSKAAK